MSILNGTGITVYVLPWFGFRSIQDNLCWSTRIDYSCMMIRIGKGYREQRVSMYNPYRVNQDSPSSPLTSPTLSDLA